MPMFSVLVPQPTLSKQSVNRRHAHDSLKGNTAVNEGGERFTTNVVALHVFSPLALYVCGHMGEVSHVHVSGEIIWLVGIR